MEIQLCSVVLLDMDDWKMHIEAHACNIRCVVIHLTNQRLWCITVCCIMFVNLFFAVKDGYNNLFAGNCTRYNRIYYTYGGGRWVSSLNNTFKLHSAILCFCFFFKLRFLLIFLAAYQFRKKSGHCSCVSQIGSVGTSSLKQTSLS